MATLTRCPRCNVTLLAAARFRRESELKCPGCFGVFPLEEALAVHSELVHEAIDSQADAVSAVDGGTYALAPSGSAAGGSSVGMPAFGAGGKRKAATVDESSIDEEEEAPTPSVRRPRQEPKGSIVGLLIMLVLGGVFGIGGGLVVVKLIRGDKFKMPVPYLEQKWQEMAGWWAGKEEAAAEPGALPPKTDPKPPPPGAMAMPEKKFIFGEGEEVPTSETEAESTNPFPALARPPKPAATGAATPAGTQPASTKPAGSAAGTAEAGAKLPPAALVGAPPATPADVTAAITALTPLMDTGAASPEAYAAACKIGSTTARMVDDASDAAGEALMSAETLLQTLTQSMPQRRELSLLAEKRFAAPAAEAGGVVVSGVVQKVGQIKKYRTLTILPAHAPKPENAITVVSNKKWRVQEGKLVSVAGVIVAKPEEQLPGATGLAAGRVLWSGVVLDHPVDN